jgi:hypothetical protein
VTLEFQRFPCEGVSNGAFNGDGTINMAKATRAYMRTVAPIISVGMVGGQLARIFVQLNSAQRALAAAMEANEATITAELRAEFVTALKAFSTYVRGAAVDEFKGVAIAALGRLGSVRTSLTSATDKLLETTAALRGQPASAEASTALARLETNAAHLKAIKKAMVGALKRLEAKAQAMRSSSR